MPTLKAGRTKRLKQHEQALLFQFVLQKGLPKWAAGQEVKCFARLLNISEQAAKAAFERAIDAGWIGRRERKKSA